MSSVGKNYMAKRDPVTTVLMVWVGAIFVFLFLPIFVVIIYSFNGGRNLYIWSHFSTVWYSAAIHEPGVLDALYVSVQAALINVVFAVALGTLAGLALARKKGAWVKPFLGLLFLVLVTPELVSAIGQLIWMNRIGLGNGLLRLAIGHSLFNVALVALIIRGRAEGVGEALEEAAADLGAPPWRAFLQITLPIMLPAVIAGALLSFTYSFDDVIISLFVQVPGSTPLPIRILSSFKTGLRGDVAAVVVMALGVSLVGIVMAALLLREGGKRQQGLVEALG